MTNAKSAKPLLKRNVARIKNVHGKSTMLA